MKHLMASAFIMFAYAYQDTNSIVESARRNGGKSTVNVDILSPVETLQSVARQASLVTRGVVSTVTTKLSRDESIVVTEFEISPVRFYKGTGGSAKTPGHVDRVIVQRAGGTLHYDGLELRTAVSEFPESESTLRVGDEVLLFLTPHEREPGKYRIAGGAYGAFRVADGNVVAWTRKVASNRGDGVKTLGLFERDLEPLVRR